MSRTLEQIFVANPATTNISTDLMYFSRSPYTAGNDVGMLFSDFAAQFGSPFTPAALTANPDTNVTIALGGTPATALLQATSITLGWTGQLSLARGGTNANLTASNGGLFYSTATAGAILAGTATANQIPLSGSNAAPSWSTATYPATTTINQILYSSAANTITGITTLNNGVLLTSATGVPTWLANSGTPGFVLTANAGAPPSWQSLAADGAITTIDGDSGSITPTVGVVTINGGSTGLTTSGAASTMSLTGVLNLAHGGTNANLTASNGGIFYSTATAGAILAGTATANQVLLSGSSTTPAWSTATYPATTTINQLLFSSAANTITGITTLNNGVLLTSATGVPTWLANSGTPGFVLTANSGAPPSWQSAAAGGAITTINGDSGSITPTAGAVTIGGGSTGLTTSGTGSTLTLTGILNLANGGTSANLTASNGGIFYSTATAGAILAGTATANRVLMSGASTTPAWSTATYPATGGTGGTILRSTGTNWANSTFTMSATFAANTLVYAATANNLTDLTTANSATLRTSSTGVPSWSASMTNGQVLIGSTGGTPTPAAITAGAGITITNAANSITVASNGSSLAVQTFAASGTYTPTSGMKFCIIECVGGGGGGGGTTNSGASGVQIAAGGGAGSYARRLSTAATVGASQTVTIGAGGGGGAAGNNTGTAGGDTSVGTLCVGKGGSGGTGNNNTATVGGLGGVAGTGDLTPTGMPGFPGWATSVNTVGQGAGGGGSSIWGGGAVGKVNGATATGNAATNYGSGGGGGLSGNAGGAAAGGAGSIGFVIITEYL